MKLSWKDQIPKLLELIGEGVHADEIAIKLGRTISAVNRMICICKRNDPTIIDRRIYRTKKWTPEKIEHLRLLRNYGLKYGKISELCKINESQLCTLLKENKYKKPKTSRYRDLKEKHPLYKIWSGMRSRCNNLNNKHYKDYGGRGITICESWNDFNNFSRDMGPRPSPKHSIDRINNNGNYEPSNCRWATNLQQSYNTRRTLFNREIATSIRQDYALGARTVDIARKYNVFSSAIHQLIRGNTYPEGIAYDA